VRQFRPFPEIRELKNYFLDGEGKNDDDDDTDNDELSLILFHLPM